MKASIKSSTINFGITVTLCQIRHRSKVTVDKLLCCHSSIARLESDVTMWRARGRGQPSLIGVTQLLPFICNWSLSSRLDNVGNRRLDLQLLLPCTMTRTLLYLLTLHSRRCAVSAVTWPASRLLLYLATNISRNQTLSLYQ